MMFDEAKYRALSVLAWVPDGVYLRLRYFQKLGFWPSLSKPKRFTEKLQWLKIHDRRPEMPMLADKLLFKQFVEKSLGSRYIIPALTTGRKPHEFSPSTVPSMPFVLKMNHDSGGTQLFPNPREVDIQETQKWIKRKLSRNFYYPNREWEYKDITPMWFTEPLLKDNSGNARLNDIKVHCFNGKPCFIQTITDREEDVKENWFNANWEPMSFFYFSPKTKGLSEPVCLQEILELARRISQPFSYVRVDFYVIHNRPVLGEVTFRPWGGFMKWSPDLIDHHLGNLLHIDVSLQDD